MAAAELAAVADEVLQFLVPTARVDVKVTALQYFLGLTGTPEGRIFMRSSEKILIALFDLTSDPLPVITKDALLAFLNLSAEEECSWKILNIEERNILPAWLKYVADKDSSHVDLVCMILSNVTRSERCCVKALEAIKKSVVTIDMLVDIFCHVGYNASGNMHYLGPVFSNLTQLVEVRQYILKSDKERCIIQRLLAFTSFMESNVRRGGVIGAIRNCCFESDYQRLASRKEVDILPPTTAASGWT
ncbi:PREDICTED: protein HGH1 homolog, partial [Priapulus caudatus]|uniref:Protein HGH1 homolog n=1 Tax=Priapulus caudatus TaxID=37621 RepID=A0ABM1ER81_PRICU